MAGDFFGEDDPLPLEEFTLDVGTTKGESRRETSVAEDHSMAGNLPLIGVAVERKTNVTRRTRSTDHRGDLTIGGDAALGDLTHRRVHALGEALLVTVTVLGCVDRLLFLHASDCKTWTAEAGETLEEGWSGENVRIIT